MDKVGLKDSNGKFLLRRFQKQRPSEEIYKGELYLDMDDYCFNAEQLQLRLQ
jgi:hypothetical protein